MQKTLGRVPKQFWHLLKVERPEIILVCASDLCVTCQCPKVTDKRALSAADNTSDKEVCRISVCRDFMNNHIYTWKPFYLLWKANEFFISHGSFWVQGSCYNGESKDCSCSLFVLCFHGIFSLTFLSALFRWDCRTECCLSDFAVLFVSSLTAPSPPLCECILSSDPSSPLPYFSYFLKNYGWYIHLSFN